MIIKKIWILDLYEVQLAEYFQTFFSELPEDSIINISFEDEYNGVQGEYAVIEVEIEVEE